MRPVFAAALVFAILALQGCPVRFGVRDLLRNERDPIELWTDTPEIIRAVELFNNSRTGPPLEIRWKPGLADALSKARRPPALVVGTYLDARSLRPRLLPLDHLLADGRVREPGFYPSLIRKTAPGNRTILLPVSFNLPLVMYIRGKVNPPNNLVIDLETLSAASAGFSRKSGGAYTRMGFSPRWDESFAILVARTTGAGFREGSPLGWDRASLASAVDRLRVWNRTQDTTPEQQDEFSFKYLFTPAYTWLSEGKALFAFSTSSRFFLFPETRLKSLDYRWFSEAGAIPVEDGVVRAGIPRDGPGRAVAEEFLAWLFEARNQERILRTAAATGSTARVFGIAGGFSSLPEINETVLPLLYPSLVGHTPPPTALSVPETLPRDWPGIARDVVGPWLRSSGAGDVDTDIPQDELAALVEGYRMYGTPIR